VFRRLGLLLGGFALAMVFATTALANAPVRATLIRPFLATRVLASTYSSAGRYATRPGTSFG
jgi:hypothetical protein